MKITAPGLKRDPMVSVIIPCYRLAQYLGEAVNSLIAQSYQCWECLIINDGSPDNTREVAAELVRRDPRVRYLEQSNGGLARARNRGLDESGGDYIVFLDADDLLLPHTFATQLATVTGCADRCVMVCDYWLMDEAGRRFENRTCTPEFQLSAPLVDLALRWETELSIPVHAFMVDARFFRDYGIRFSEALPNHEDWDCWMRVFRLYPTVHRVREKLAVYRVRLESMSRDEDKMWRGFRQAIALQMSASSTDRTLRRMLAYKTRLTDDFYDKTFRKYLLTKLRRTPWFGRFVPQIVQRAIYRHIDLSDLRAHGWS